ncbi:MAG: squalene synthase HpnC [Nitrospirae bacterium]|nr:squalene synthase HpnC [Nitrospirota bacterium]
MSEASKSFSYCSSIASGHYENFPVGSWLIPREKKKYVHTIYAFARKADDFADEKVYREEERLQLLEDWENRLEGCIDGGSKDPVFIALKETIEKFDIPVGLLKNLIVAFKMDTVNKRYKKMSDVLNYCDYSANPVGRIVLHLFEYKDPELHRLSDFICTALQLTNFWQDIAIDLEKDRIYLPLEDMERFGYTVDELKSHVINDTFRDLLAGKIRFTRGLFTQGLPLCTSVGKDLSLELRAVWSGGMKILEKIEKNGYDVFNRRPVITALDKVKIFSRALIMGH